MEASICFPNTLPRFCGQAFMEREDKELALLCVRAYNDWMIDEWCAGEGRGRLVPLTMVPLWDAELAAEEVRRTAAKGSFAVTFSENPHPLGLPTIHDPKRYWDPLFAAAQETDLVVCMHVGSSSTMPKISPSSPFMANMAWGAIRTAGTMLSWLFSGYFQRLPNLKIALSEGGVGWMPYFLERAEQVVDKQRFWATRGESFTGYGTEHAGADNNLDGLDVRRLFRDHVYGCFIEDVHGMSSIDVLGVDNIMVETDYPHTDSTWPDSIKLAREQVAHLSPEVQYKLLRGNAERLFRFTPADPPTRAT